MFHADEYLSTSSQLKTLVRIIITTTTSETVVAFTLRPPKIQKNKRDAHETRPRSSRAGSSAPAERARCAAHAATFSLRVMPGG